jgi:hypothetical protein
MNGGQNMYNLADWVEIECEEADRIRGAQPVRPGSSLTDLDGEYGDAVMYTEWWDEHDRAVLRDYMWAPLADDRHCTHFAPEVTA